MQHIKMTRPDEITSRRDHDRLALWFGDHNVDVLWIRQEQNLAFAPGHVWYDQYRHTAKGEVAIDPKAGEPITERIHHVCDIRCDKVRLPRLSHYKIEDGDGGDQSDQ